MIPSGTNLAFYKGQPVTVAIGSGAAVNGATIATGRMVFKPWTANTDAIFGIFAGIEYVDATGKPVVSDTWPASQTLLAGARQTVYIWDDPLLIYRAQMDR
jgi:membrane associated rhomboid family serine protease